MAWGVSFRQFRPVARRAAAVVRARRSLCGLVIVAAAMLLEAAGPASAQVNTFTTSETRSETVLPPVTTTTTTTNSQIAVPGGGPLPGLLSQMVNGPSGGAVLNALTRVLGPAAASQTSTTTSTTTSTSTPTGTPVVGVYTTFGPAVIPIGNNPGTMNCNGAPSPASGVGVWPVSNCNFAGYQMLTVSAGAANLNTNTHNFFLTQALTQISIVNQTQVNLTAQGSNWLTGDLHTSFQTSLIDDGFRFFDTLIDRGRDNGAANGMAPGGPLAYAGESTAAATFEDALAMATKARAPVTVAMAGGWRAWLRGSGGYAKFDGTDANFGFKSRTASGEGGIERVAGPWLYGAAFGYGAAKVTQDTTGDRGEIDTYRGGAYASYRPGAWSFTGAVAVGFSNLDARRLAALPVVATASYDATTISAGVEAVRRIQLAHATFEPMAGLVYTGLRVDSFTETGTTLLDLSGSRADIDALKGYVGGRLYNTYGTPGGLAFTPEVRGRLLYDFLDDPRGFTARFIADPAATPLPVTGIQPDRFGVMLGGAVNARFAPGWRAFASYDAELRGGDVAHLGSAGVKGNW